MPSRPISKILPVFSTFIVMGFVDIVGVSTGYVQKDFGLTDTLAQFLPTMVFVWFFALSVPFGVLQDKVGKKQMMIAGVSLTFLATAILPLMEYTYWSVIAAFVLLGIGNTIIQVAANPLLQEVSARRRLPSFLSLSQFMKSVTALFGPLMVTFMAVQYGDWKLAFWIYALISVVSLAWLRNTPIEEKIKAKKTASFRSCFSLMKNAFVIKVVLAIFLVVGADVGMYANIQAFLMRLHHVSLENASYGISVYFTAQMIGRFSGAVLLRFLKPFGFLIASCVFSVLGIAVLYWSMRVLWAYTAIAMIGFGAANLFPLLFSLAIGKMRRRSNEISGLLVMAIVGGAVIPPVLGLISTFGGVRLSILMVGVVFVSIFVLSLLFRPKSKGRK
ncbi:MFS transporter [Echinicola sediminis]